MRQLNVLVTGVGAIIGYGIIKSLRQSAYQIKIIGMDIFKDAVGRVWCDDFVQGVRADSDQFSSFINKLVDRFNIDLIIPGIEQDIDMLARMVYQESFDVCKVALNTEQALYTFNNKKLTYRLLEALGLPSIPFALSETESAKHVIDIIGVPCILKPNISYAGKGLLTIRSEDDLQRHCGKEGFVFQQKVTSGIEYTISVFGLGNCLYCNPVFYHARSNFHSISLTRK